MRNNRASVQSMDFAVPIINSVKAIPHINGFRLKGASACIIACHTQAVYNGKHTEDKR